MNQLELIYKNKRLYNDSHNRYTTNKSSAYTALDKAHQQIMNNYFDKEIERLTEKAIQEKVISAVQNIDFSVSLDGEKITNAVIEKITDGIGVIGR